jgi:phosphatidylserine/phosphatidylglycerophosphate/cardiolipin synthase-like enzyme
VHALFVSLGKRRIDAALVADAAHYDELVCQLILKARLSVFIATANLKDLHVEAPIGTRARARGKFVSMYERLTELANAGVEVRILHGGVPSGPFRARLAAAPSKKRATGGGSSAKKAAGVELRRCPRVHLKVVAVDGAHLYLGSANFTGAGLGAKADGRRNFEMGLLTDDDVFMDATLARFDAIWQGKECASCKLRRECPRPLDLGPPAPKLVVPRAPPGPVLAGNSPPKAPKRSDARSRA